MSFVHLVETLLLCSALPALLFFWNTLLYKQPPNPPHGQLAPISVLIPARNEEPFIAAAVNAVLASSGVDLEIVVLDDSSTDRTAEIVAAIAAQDSRLRVESAPPLPSGWNGKQHACYQLSLLARHSNFCFLDADVRLQPEALARMAAFQGRSRSELVSGFPFQQTKTFLEWLLLPLIHFVLLAYLPIAAMRIFTSAGLAAGCGQFLMVTREAYERSGGHANIRTTMHDGILLPRLLRKHGYRTDIADLTQLATCRMYHNAKEVWGGLAKNATEGLAAPSRIMLFTFLLFFGQVAPSLVAVTMLLTGFGATAPVRWAVFGAVVASLLPRLIAVGRYRQRLLSAALHPIGVAVLLALQWYALFRKLTGRTATWKQRAYNLG